MDPFNTTPKEVGLTDKQHRFCLEYLATDDKESAYQAAYDIPKNAERKYLSTKALEILKKDKIIKFLKKANKPLAKKYGITREKVTEMYLETYQMAKMKEETSVMSSTTERLSKLYGLNEQKEGDTINFINVKREDMVKRLVERETAIETDYEVVEDE